MILIIGGYTMLFDDISFENNSKTIADEYENCLENINCLQINRMPARVNLIPAQKPRCII